MQEYTHEQHKKEVFARNPYIKELYEKEVLRHQISQQLKDIRNKKRISQFDLAKKIGTTQSVIARIEKGNTNISMRTLEKMLFGLGARIKIES